MTELERLVATEAIRTLQSRYVRCVDTKDWTALSGLFLPGAQFIPYDLDGIPQAVMTGQVEIIDAISTSIGKGTTLHHLFSYEIDVETPTRATGVWAMEDWLDRSNDDSSTGTVAQFKTILGAGYYHVVYENVDGTWFIADLKLVRTKLEITH